MEIARVMGSMVKSGWRPRRTIVFASWAVEEYGSEGSFEYVYENINKLTERYEVLINIFNLYEHQPQILFYKYLFVMQGCGKHQHGHLCCWAHPGT